MSYYLQQLNNQLDLIGAATFNGNKGGGEFKNSTYPYVLADGDNNLYNGIRDDVKRYFAENQIGWWSGETPTGHILSSQMACLNHLFAYRHNRQAVLDMINGVWDEFVDVLPIECDVDKPYISFEVVSAADHLNELNVTRGANCTSIDAFVLARHKTGEIWLVPIEWKYTEHYAPEDKSAGSKGATRIGRYNDLIKASRQLQWFDDYKVYYQEPFYQLMRQTLWAEQVVAHKDTEVLKADNYLHIHVIPDDNETLLKRGGRYVYKVSGKGMEATWRSCLKDQTKYVIVDHKKLLEPVASVNPALTNYLQKRYWRK